MRLFTRTGATALDDPEFGHFDAAPDGGFDLPEELADRLHGFHAAGLPMWENDVERQRRMMSEELERRQDPATLLAVVEQLMQATVAAKSSGAAGVGSASTVTVVDGPEVKPRGRKTG